MYALRRGMQESDSEENIVVEVEGKLLLRGSIVSRR